MRLRAGLVLVAVLATGPAHAAEWSQPRVNSAGTAVDFQAPQKQVSLFFQSRIVPGEELLVVKATPSGAPEPYFVRYVFRGVVNGALQLAVMSGGRGRAPWSAADNPGAVETRYIERAADGAFYFVPIELKDEAQFKIMRVGDAPAYYAVTLVKAAR